MGPHSCLCLPCLLWGLEGHLGPPEGRNRVGQPGASHYSEVHTGPFPQPGSLGPSPTSPPRPGGRRVSEGKTAGGARGTHRGPRKSYARGPREASESSRYGSSMGSRRKCKMHSSCVRLPTCSDTLFQSSLYISSAWWWWWRHNLTYSSSHLPQRSASSTPLSRAPSELSGL